MKVTLGVTGGIAAYKAAELVRALQAKALEVQVVMTGGAQRFIQPLTFAALTGRRVITSLWEEQAADEAAGLGPAMEHIELAQETGALLIAPASASTVARLAHGDASDFLSTLYLATPAPVLVAPAMNVRMWEHPAVQENLALLEERGAIVIQPGAGALACGMTGPGRLADIPQIVEATLGALQRSESLAGQTVVVTAGGTREAIDPVRFLGNRSSGKMGYALAEAAARRGARVVLISAPTALRPPSGCELIQVVTAAAMRDAALHMLPQADLLIMAAAVADYRPSEPSETKLRRSGPLTLALEPTEDILALLAAERRPGTLLVGFAAETANAEEALGSGRSKLVRKGVDAIVLNDVSRPGLGFDGDRNAATFLTRTTAVDLPAMHKRELAGCILDEIARLRRPERVIAEFDESLTLEH